ncbi:phosphonate metabolism protein/1,5-bisphosphokinase (PRPP-forming) PhnN [Pseudodesulfovibrio piezophilus]|uniref:Ribose 1,5-bisphosphate phosphokinase PhnN n=1 Tax=Pseudodesulfovibrio piezophilus (strain DSM 21447 / JCM 15486 / C1TLV30) TaxID=1322246 RepID=M1WLI1_PSEP2|nr:phosphonate metabolism protein/1,5-bisphosphokinase (PRPP-forming) PhnN [Pseudodesulfovibrio piezophilus]CCH47905.1 ATP-binding protein phnN [Pseudodesulfovibrio piezophilus C1TLV30]
MKNGRLIYVVGPSGCGKDSVINYARARCPGKEAIFAHRYITRPITLGSENHIYLHPDEFKARLDRNLFALQWDSHGFRYGIGAEIDLWMDAGFPVIMNGSRAYLSEASSRYPNIVPILVTVETEILRQRLLARGRESGEEIESRLQRANAFGVEHPSLQTIDNSGELVEAGESLLKLVRGKLTRVRHGDQNKISFSH